MLQFVPTEAPLLEADFGRTYIAWWRNLSNRLFRPSYVGGAV